MRLPVKTFHMKAWDLMTRRCAVCIEALTRLGGSGPEDLLQRSDEELRTADGPVGGLIDSVVLMGCPMGCGSDWVGPRRVVTGTLSN